MKAQVFYRSKDVRYEEIDVPAIGPRDALVRVRSALTCGSDLKTYMRGHPTMIEEESVFGHEYAGDIVELGNEVKDLKVGDRVVAMNSAPCHKCYYCKLERFSLCENITYNNGAYAEYIKIPDKILNINTFKIPNEIDYKEAALTESLACVVHGSEESNIKTGDTVVVNGSGPIGLMHIYLAKLHGARVIATDLSDERLKFAKEFGADQVINATRTHDQVNDVKKLTDSSYGADVVVESTGFPDVWKMSILMARKGGLINLFGGCPPGASISIDTNLVHYSELTIKGIYHHTPYYVRKAFKLITTRQIKASKLITKDIPLKEMITALELMKEQRGIKYNIVS